MEQEPRLVMDAIRNRGRGGATAGASRSSLARLGRTLGLWPREIREILALYDATAEEQREMSRFVTLMARYQRFVGWRAAMLRSGSTGI